MKRITSLLALLSLLAGCTSKETKTDGTIVTTIGMIADITRQIVGDKKEVVNLIPEGLDPHTHSPTKSEMDKVKQADLVLYNGLHLEAKFGQILEARAKQGLQTLAVAENLADVELLQAEGENDPHVWNDVLIWSKVAENITNKLAEIDPDNADHYRTNLKTLQNKLSKLNDYAIESIASIPQDKRVLVTAHDAFSYMARSYGLTVRGVQGISTDAEASPRDRKDLVEFLVEKQIPAVFVETSVNDKSIRSVIESCAAQNHQVTIGGKLYSDCMGEKGTPEGTYIGMINHNITTITNALGGQAEGFKE